MQRDMELVRALLLKIESATEPVDSAALEVEGFDSESIQYHVRLLAEAELLHAADTANRGNRYAMLVFRLTWNGHEFLDAARDNTTWSKARGSIKSSIGSASLQLLQRVLLTIGAEGLRSATGIDVSQV